MITSFYQDGGLFHFVVFRFSLPLHWQSLLREAPAGDGDLLQPLGCPLHSQLPAAGAMFLILSHLGSFQSCFSVCFLQAAVPLLPAGLGFLFHQLSILWSLSLLEGSDPSSHGHFKTVTWQQDSGDSDPAAWRWNLPPISSPLPLMCCGDS